MVFGTADRRGANSQEQKDFLTYIQSVWVDFAKNPEHALTRLYKWPMYVEHEETLVRLAHENAPRPDFVLGLTYDKSGKR